MALTALIFGVVGAVLVVADVADRWRTTTTVLDGGGADTDFDAEERRARRRALWSLAGPACALVAAILLMLAAQ